MSNEIWNRTLNGIKQRLNDHSFKTWIDPLKFRALNEKRVEVIAPNKFFDEWIHDHFVVIIKEEINKAVGETVDVSFLIEDEPSLKDENSPVISMPFVGAVDTPKQKPVVITSSNNVSIPAEQPHIRSSHGEQLNPKYNFDTFVVGASNQFAHAAAYAVAEQPGKAYNPLFIFGGVGLGKTHLLNAIGNQILKKNPASRIFYVSSEKFMNELINCIRYEKMDEFRRKYRDSIDVLLMDDIQFIAGKERTMEEFFHTFNALYGSRKQIVVTSDKFPKDIEGLEERLRTRFGWGLIADIQSPEMETRVAILKSKAELDDIYLPDSVAIFLASNIKSNIRELEGSLIRIGAYSSLTGMEISVDLVKEVLKNIIKNDCQEITVETIQKAVANFFDIKMPDMKSRKKLKVLAVPRQIAMYLSRQYTKKSFPDIGKAFGGKDHSTVIHAVNKIEQELKENLTLKQQIDAIVRSIER